MRDVVLVVGSGMMGSGIAAMSALAGNKTILNDISPEQIKTGIEKAYQCIDLRAENGLNTPQQATAAKELISGCDDLVKACENTRLVIEAIVEKVEIKQQLFAKLDELLPTDVAICSNTSGLRITDISATSTNKQRMVTTHFWLPAHLVPLVEVVMGEQTDRDIALKVCEELKAWDKAPVLVNKDLPGQLANRVFQAIIRESIDIVASGLASAEDVDTAISCGMAMRFPVWGPLKHLDAVGVDLGLSVQETVLPSIAANRSAGDHIKQMVQDGRLGAKAGKGFYDWSERDIAQDMKKRDSFIIEAVKVCNKLNKDN